MTAHWHRKLADALEAERAAEELRDYAQGQQRHVEEDLAPRVDAVVRRLRKLRQDNHFGPMIDAILRGGG